MKQIYKMPLSQNGSQTQDLVASTLMGQSYYI